MAAINMIKK